MKKRILQNVSKKLLAAVLAFAMVITGLYVIEPTAEEVKASDTKETIEPNEVAEGMLDVKMQIQEDSDGNYNMRLVSSVNGLGYYNVGFEVYFDADGNGAFDEETEKVSFTTSTVLEKINATATGVTYKFSPKVIDTDAEYFITGTLMDIHKDKLANDFYVRAFCTSLEDEKTVTYGTGRYFNITDATSAGMINIPVKMPEGKVEKGESIQVTVAGGTPTTATVEAYIHGYAHLNVSVTDKTSLASASKIAHVAVSDDPEVGIVELGNDAIYRNLESTYDVQGADTSWYDAYAAIGETEYVIATDADLWGMAQLNAKNAQFLVGEIFYLVADITINEGTPTTKAEWDTYLTTDAAKNLKNWVAIGDSMTYFGGTFDGQGHTIKGVYMNATKAKQGLFGSTLGYGRATVKNFSLEDSYFTTSSNMLGSIAGEGMGTFDSIYSNAVVVTDVASQFVGGMIGSANNDLNNTFTNLWFDGYVYASYSDSSRGGATGVAGILGGFQHTVINNADLTISDCINSGTIENHTTGWPSAGGVIGVITVSVTNYSIKVGNLLNVGTVSIPNCADYSDSIARAGAIIGNANKGTITSTGYCYASPASYGTNMNTNNKVGGQSALYTAGYFVNDVALGFQGYYAANFSGYDYETVWALRNGTYPVPQAFAETRLPAPDTSWYTADTTAESFTIDSIQDLAGLAKLNMNTTGSEAFYGKTIYLGADIELNEGDSAVWGKFAPEYEWIAIGSTSYPFRGTLDGQGHTISGIYLKSVDVNQGLFASVDEEATVKDLKLTNSYLSTTNEGLGSIAGICQGTLEGVYSDATLDGSGSVGGLIGTANPKNTTDTTATVTLNSCWYEGNATASGQRLGGLIGTAWSSNVRMDNCLSAGNLTSTYTPDSSTGEIMVGGLIGMADGKIMAYVSMTNCLVAGKLTASIADASLVTGNRVNYAVGHWNNGAPVNTANQALANNMPITTNLYGVKGVTPSDYVVGLSLVNSVDLLADAETAAPNLFTGTATWTARAGQLPIPSYFSQ